MKKTLLALGVAVMAIPALAENMGELPLGEKFTLSKDEVYTFNPSANGVLSIEFEGTYPDAGLVFSDLYNPNFNREMEFLPLLCSNADPILGQKSPAIYEIKKDQPAASGTTGPVRYEIIGPDEVNVLDPDKSITSIEITCTFTPTDYSTVLTPTVSPISGSKLGYYDISNLNVYFEPNTFGVKCSSIDFNLYENDILVKSFPGSDLEMTWEYNSGESNYYINLQNLLLYELEDSNYDKFTITLSGFNYPLEGDLINENGDLEVTYYYDQWYGVIQYVTSSELPTIHPNGATSTLTLTYQDNLGDAEGEVQLLGTYIPELNAEPAAKTPVYAPEYTIEGKTIVINFANFIQTGPYDDAGNLQSTNGYSCSGTSMSLIVRGFMGAEGQIVQPCLLYLNFDSTPLVNSKVTAVESAEGSWTVCNLQGIRLLSTSSYQDVLNLPKGIYIVNGKKVVL